MVRLTGPRNANAPAGEARGEATSDHLDGDHPDHSAIDRIIADLDALGVPIFTAPPIGDDYRRPHDWQALDPSGNAARIAAWRDGDAIMAVTGGPIAVLDVDTKNGADIERVRQMLASQEIRVYAEIATPSGGAHFYVAGSPDLPNVAASEGRDGFDGWPGLELLSHGRNVFLPGTRRAKYGGLGYVTVRDDLPVLADGGDPDSADQLAGWAAANRKRPGTPITADAPAWDGRPPSRREAAYLRKALSDQASELAAMEPNSGRNNALNIAAVKLAGYVAGAGLPADEVTAALLDACRKNGLTAEDGEAAVMATIASGIRYGLTHPKAVPADPLEIATLPGTGDRQIAPDAAPAGIAPARVTDRFIDGGTFILDVPAEIPSIWGNGEQSLWARGETLTIVGPSGVGKTTVGSQLVDGRLTGASVLGMAVTPTDNRVLYMAMDRPMQARRAFHRNLAGLDRKLLADRLVVWQGPPPADVAKHPEVLLDLAEQAGADTIFIDSLKDAAIGLSDDEVGAGYNRARQLALANGVEMVELHHLVKRGANGTKPTTLADVYGSAWITAGAGSVVLLWGAAGDPIVELQHLKQPAEEFGPVRVIHDHEHGTSAIWHATDLVTLARAAGSDGLTAKAAAVAVNETDKPTPAMIEKARRRLNSLVRSGQLYRLDGDDAAQRPTSWTAVTDPHGYPHGLIPDVTPSRGPHGLTPESKTPDQTPSRLPSRPSRAGTLTLTPSPVRRGESPRCLAEGCLQARNGGNFCTDHQTDPSWGGLTA